jgi:hypothetical protein
MAGFRSPFAARVVGAAVGKRVTVFGEPNGGTRKPAGGEGTNKFSAKTCGCSAGHSHPSKAEARRCDQLHLLQHGGVIADLEVQPQFWFVINGAQVKHEGGRRVGYRADFAYREGGKHVVEDVKGAYRDDAWTLRKAIFRALFPQIELREVA